VSARDEIMALTPNTPLLQNAQKDAILRFEAETLRRAAEVAGTYDRPETPLLNMAQSALDKTTDGDQ
jgi:hypothetical protein